MGKIISIIFIVVLLASCNQLDYKYHVVGKVITKTGLKDAEWYTDTLSINNDTLFYKNSDSSIVKIYPPYTVYEITN